jgi:hypothetical protein
LGNRKTSVTRGRDDRTGFQPDCRREKNWATADSWD